MERRNNTINKKAVLAAATIVFTFSLSSSNVLTAERAPVAQVTEEEEKRPVALYFSSQYVGESDNITVEGENEAAIPVFCEEVPEASLMLAEILPKKSAADIQYKEQAGLKIEKAPIEQDASRQFKSAFVQQSEKYTEAEKEMIAKVVYAEARGESFDGQVAVAQVVINRFESGKFGASLKRIVYGRYQFAVSRRYAKASMEAVEYAIENMPYPTDMYFFRVSKSKRWRNFVYYNRIGNHSFYCGKE